MWPSPVALPSVGLSSTSAPPLSSLSLSLACMGLMPITAAHVGRALCPLFDEVISSILRKWDFGSFVWFEKFMYLLVSLLTACNEICPLCPQSRCIHQACGISGPSVVWPRKPNVRTIHFWFCPPSVPTSTCCSPTSLCCGPAHPAFQPSPAVVLSTQHLHPYLLWP